MQHLPDPATVFTLILAFGVAPFVALMMTCYTKLVIVFGLLRTALGLQQTPPNLVLNGIAVILSIYVMAPVAMEIGDNLKLHPAASTASPTDQISSAAAAAEGPMRAFLKKHAQPRERQFFLKTAKEIWPAARAQSLRDDDLMVLVPSFTLSEITRAFQIGFVIYLVFVVVDLIVATILLALGMSMLSPSTISLPFKLLLFVMLDGWERLIHALVLSYR